MEVQECNTSVCTDFQFQQIVGSNILQCKSPLLKPCPSREPWVRAIIIQISCALPCAFTFRSQELASQAGAISPDLPSCQEDEPVCRYLG